MQKQKLQREHQNQKQLINQNLPKHLVYEEFYPNQYFHIYQNNYYRCIFNPSQLDIQIHQQFVLSNIQLHNSKMEY